MTSYEENNNRKKSSKVNIILLILCILLAGSTIYFAVNVRTVIKEKEVFVNKAGDLQSELNTLLAEHEKIKSEYGDLKNQLTDKDSVILANAEEIKHLIASQADYYKIRKKLDLLRKISQGYVAKLDSLYTVNAALTAENTRIKEEVVQERKQKTVLTQEKEVLQQKVDVASLLKAVNISPSTVRLRNDGKKEVATDKAKKVERINICYTVSENKVAAPGKRTAYIRIARPDGAIVSEGKGDQYSFDYKGEKLQYSMKKEFDYQNKDMNICTYWDKREGTDGAMTGKYTVTIYCDGIIIGESSFELK